MRIAVMGAGGIGSYLGGMLAHAGEDVTLVCRGAHLAALRNGGLKLGQHRVKVRATDDPGQAGTADFVVQAVKLYDLASSSRAMLPMLGASSVVVTVQNGVTAAEEAGAIAGRGRVVGGTVFINAHVVAPGEVQSKSETNTFLMDAGAAALAERCRAAGIDAKVSPDIVADQWRKFIPVAGLSALSCLSRQPIGPVREDPALRRLYRQAMQEVADLAAAKGVRLEADIVERMLAQAGRYKYDARVSMLEDLEAGKKLELDWLSGYVSREGARSGVPVPFHDMAYACLKPLSK